MAEKGLQSAYIVNKVGQPFSQLTLGKSTRSL